MSVEQAEQLNAQVTETAAQDGLEYHLDRAQGGNTFDAHRMIHLAASHGLQDEAEERLMRAYFGEGEAISDPETLVRLVAEAGVDAGEARAVLAGDDYADAVREDEELATRLGVRGVPFFVLGRRYGVSGAQPAEALLQALEQAYAEQVPTSG
jgi:predicted DsbA family dithiol-disulfide isomerase